MRFRYKAMSESGGVMSGVVESYSEKEARDTLSKQGLLPLEFKVESKLKGQMERLFLPRVDIKELVLFTKQFRTMFNAGVPITQIFRVLHEQSSNKRLQRVMEEMSEQISAGSSLYASFSAHPDVFSPLYCAMVRAGETSGSLGNVLDRLTYILEHDAKLVKSINGALWYPKIVILAIVIAFVVILTMVLPAFIDLFEGMQLELPLATKIAIGMYEFMLSWWWAILGIVIGIFVGFKAFVGTDRGRLIYDTFLIRLPLIGLVIQMGAMARFASIFSILQFSGVTVLESLAILRSTLNNAAIAKDFDKIEELLKEGKGIAVPLASSKYFTPLLVNMVSIGEESGNMDEMLTEVAKHYDEEVEIAVEKLTAAIPPLLMAVLGLVVIFFAAAIYSPVFGLIDSMTVTSY